MNPDVAELQNYRITELQNYRITELQDCRRHRYDTSRDFIVSHI